MERSRTGGFGGFNVKLTPLAKNTLIALIGIYVVQLVLIHWLHLPVERWLYLWPFGSGGWVPWQPLTSQALNSAVSPLAAVFDWVVIYFFAGQVERMFTTRRYLKAMGFALAVAVVSTTLLDGLGALNPAAPFVGQHALTIALIAFFGLSLPHAQIMLFPIPIQIKASWVAWGTGLISLLYFLIGRDLDGSMALFGWVGAWGWLNSGDLLSRLRSRRQDRERERELSRFTVHPGGRDDDQDEYIH